VNLLSRMHLTRPSCDLTRPLGIGLDVQLALEVARSFPVVSHRNQHLRRRYVAPCEPLGMR